VTDGISESFADSVRYKIREDKIMKPSNRHLVLYAEDNEDSRQMVSIMCEFANIEVVTAQTVAEAWRVRSAHADSYLFRLRV
jgi:hypothetical protein